MLKKYKFLSRLIDHYKTPESLDSRGFIIMICNTLRFSAEIQSPSGWLRRYLGSHESWKSFIPDLRAQTLEQMKRYQSDIYAEEEDSEFDEGIDLGSAYARSLGFDGEPNPLPSPEPQRKKKKKRTKKGKESPDPENSNENNSTGKEEDNSPPQENSNQKGGSPQADTTDTKSSEFSWWTDMVQDMKKDEEAKGNPLDSTNWWVDLKKELEEGESPQEPGSSWWNDLKSELEEAK